MTLGLHNLASAHGSRRKTRRVGRGHGSGRGTYSGRGQKGQRSRSGGRSGLKLLGLKQMLRSKPKIGGFQSLRPKLGVVSLVDLGQHFSANAQVNLKALRRLDLVSNQAVGVKILGGGKLDKALQVTANAFSAAAKKAILDAGGTAKLTQENPR